MDLQEVLSALNIREGGDVWADEWGNSQQSLPAPMPQFLQPEYLQAACQSAYIPGNIADEVLVLAQRVQTAPALIALAWHCHHVLFRSTGNAARRVRQWPVLSAALGDQAGLFYLIILLSGVNKLRQIYQDRQIPEPIAADTFSDIKIWLDDYRMANGTWGISPSVIGWLMNHFRGELYRLGRLQFHPGPFWAKVHVFRHRQDRRVVALSDAGVRYRGDGFIDGADGLTDPVTAWTAHFAEHEDRFVGQPITPLGRALPQTVVLNKEEWERALAPGDPTLHIHIPTGSAMDFDQCGASFQQALAFFPRHFPDKPFKAFCCGSWFLDPQFEKLLAPTSNIVRFLQEVYLFPIQSNRKSTLERVFRHIPGELHELPRDTSMRRAILDHLQNGGHLSGGGCFLFPEDLRWGSQVYRRQPMPW